MSILTQQTLLDHICSETMKNLADVIDCKQMSFNITNYTQVIESIDKATREFALTMIQRTLEEMDDAFFNSVERKRDYNVKDKRSRTLATVFGQVTYTRRIYKPKGGGKCFTYVDRRVGMPRYDYYDPTVKAKIVEAYANSNSMIKVGQIIGEQMHTSFSLNSDRKNYNISRQTVHNIVKHAHKLYPKIDRTNTTPKTLYIMADEKHVNLQKNNKNSAMVKHCVIFEGVKVKNKRVILENKLYFSGVISKFWENVHDHLAHVYDFDKIENIILMGDGASWIKAGAQELPKATFLLDKFHTFQAVTTMTRDSLFRTNLRDAIIKDDKKKFKELINDLKTNNKNNEAKIKKIEDKAKYILGHWDAIQRAHCIESPGCSMEAQISHNLASTFSSRPKAYAKKNLEVYLSTRDLYLNGIDIVSTYINTLSYEKSDKPQPIEKEVLDLSMFDPRTSYDKSSTSNWTKGFIARH